MSLQVRQFDLNGLVWRTALRPEAGGNWRVFMPGQVLDILYRKWQVLKNEAENEDLRNFAWSALKSVGAGSREHPCGGTVAEHMRSLYRAEWEDDEQ